ncbi:hypothetical protein Mal4_01340 [Maioricimonas rarisocia]|uniref:Uncharacterized protein n=1 Tax=Maioricimonas rarisocia TaxID=2528026 RepID=A0A517Z044_9PLAN|nr:hypothetical protein [Maioricimonas rarisocia]QDU35852.1 hypothetical protein Mal4_01340 [Maioricimonas rarisocia]
MEVVESEYRPVPTDDGTASVWSPHRVSYRDVENGTTTFQEDLEVTFVPDSDLPESEFTLAAMELIQGRKVVDETLKVSVWDDGRLRRVTGRDVYDANKRGCITVGRDRNTLEPASAQDRPSGRWTALLAVNAGVVALLLLLLAAKRLLRRE